MNRVGQRTYPLASNNGKGAALLDTRGGTVKLSEGLRVGAASTRGSRATNGVHSTPVGGDATKTVAGVVEGDDGLCYGIDVGRHDPSQSKCLSSARLWAVETKEACEVDEMGAVEPYSQVTSLSAVPASRCTMMF